MTTGAYALAGLVWLSLVGLAVALLFLRSPRKRKSQDEIEAAFAALKLRLIDLEDKHETFVKRDAVRVGRAKREEAAQPELGLVLTPEQKKADLIRRFRAQRTAQGGG